MKGLKKLLIIGLAVAQLSSISYADVIFKQVGFTSKSTLSYEDEEAIRKGTFNRTIYLKASIPVTSQMRDNMMKLLKKQVGKPYVWGANGPKSFDCSGLVNYIYEQNGYKMPCVRCTTWSYPSFTKVVSKENALPGDIMLYEGHVMIYAGNNKVIHARSPKYGVIEEDLNTVLNRRSDVEFRRFTSMKDEE